MAAVGSGVDDMIKIIADGKGELSWVPAFCPMVVKSLRFKYFNAETERWHDRDLTLKGLLQARKSGNNCYWSFYMLGCWHNDFVFCYDIRKPNEITIKVLNTLASREATGLARTRVRK